MAILNFTAERSLYQTSAHYRGTASFGSAEGIIQLAQDPDCFARCQDLCVPDCLELVGNARGACLRACRSDCLDACSGPPPVTCGPCAGTRRCSDGSTVGCSCP
jgi:hypothetical protein